MKVLRSNDILYPPFIKLTLLRKQFMMFPTPIFYSQLPKKATPKKILKGHIDIKTKTEYNIQVD